MNWIDAMMNSINYMEDHIFEDMTILDIARAANASPFYYQRMFMVLTDMSVQTYVRNRRLTLAAMELMASEMKVIDIALKYGYESAEAFSRAFKKVHGSSPIEVKNKQKSIQAFMKLTIQISLKGDVPMKYRLEEVPGFSFYGMTREFSTVDGSNFKEIPLFWNEVMANGSFEAMISKSNSKKCLGVCMPMDYNKDVVFDYIIGGFTDEAIEGYDFHTVESAEWAIFEIHGPISESLQSTWKQIFSEWFPQTGFKHADLPEIEVYFDGDVNGKDYYMEVWIPIIR